MKYDDGWEIKWGREYVRMWFNGFFVADFFKIDDMWVGWYDNKFMADKDRRRIVKEIRIKHSFSLL